MSTALQVETTVSWNLWILLYEISSILGEGEMPFNIFANKGHAVEVFERTENVCSSLNICEILTILVKGPLIVVINSQCLYVWKKSKLVKYFYLHILKAIKNATGTSVIFPINTRLIHFVVVLTSVPNVGERFTKT